MTHGELQLVRNNAFSFKAAEPVILNLCDECERLQKALELIWKSIQICKTKSYVETVALNELAVLTHKALSPAAQVPAPDASETTTDSPGDPGVVGS